MSKSNMQFRLWNMVLVFSLMLGGIIITPASAQAREGPDQLFLNTSIGQQDSAVVGNRSSAGDSSSTKADKPVDSSRQLQSLNQEEAALWVADYGIDNGWAVDQHPRLLADVNGDGMDDVVGFANEGVFVALSDGTSFTTPTLWVAEYGVNNGWAVVQHPRMMADVNGDAMDDVIGFSNVGPYVALSTGASFTTPEHWLQDYGVNNGWTVDDHPRMMADVNGDGMDDVVGFANQGVYVALSTGIGFSTPELWVEGYGTDNGWTGDKHVRELVDVNGDDKADVVGFANTGVYVALSTGTGFSTLELWNDDYGYDAGWDVTQHPRIMADVDGDRMSDIVGFADEGVHISISTGTAFVASELWIEAYGLTAGGWEADKHPRMVADVDGDEMFDIVGFSDTGVHVSFSNRTHFLPQQVVVADYGNTAGWQVGLHPRMTADVDGDGQADIVGFGDEGVFVTLAGVVDNPAAATFNCGLPFTDISPSAPYYLEVVWLWCNEITRGTTATTFSPDGILNRSQFVTFLWRYAGWHDGNPPHGFNDVPNNQFYTEAVKWAKAEGVTTGTTATTFAPANTVTKAQMITFLWRYAGEPFVSGNGGYLDVPTGVYYTTPVAWGKSVGIFTDNDQYFEPGAAAKRFEMAQYLYQLGVVQGIKRLDITRFASSRLSNAEADAILAEATTVLQSNDGTGDTACAVTFIRNHNVRVFQTGDGSIDTADELNATFNIPEHVKVVNEINFCDILNPNIIGCARTPGRTLIVERRQNLEGILWAHEFGHNQGLNHVNEQDPVRLMNSQLAGTARRVTTAECNTFRIDRSIPAAVTAASVLTSSKTDELNSMDIQEFVRQVFIEGVPFEIASSYDSSAVPILVNMLQDPAEKIHWANVAVVLGMIGGDDAVAPLISFIEAGSNKEALSDTYYKAKTSAIMSLGYAINKTGNQQALDYLVEGLELEAWENRQIIGMASYQSDITERNLALRKHAIFGLTLSGHPQAATALLSTQQAANPNGQVAGLSQGENLITAMLEEHQKISSQGLDEYYQDAHDEHEAHGAHDALLSDDDSTMRLFVPYVIQ